MKGLIIKKEHLDKILDCAKTWEMRSTRTKIRGKIFLIESGSGKVMGEATLVDCKEPLTPYRAKIGKPWHQVDDLTLLEKWKYPWVLCNAKRYDKPIAYKHPRGAVIWVSNLNVIGE